MTARGIGRTAHSHARRTRGAGFTLVEILIAVALIGTVSAIAVPIYFRALETARVGRAVGDIRSIAAIIGIHRIKTGSYPASLQAAGVPQMVDPWGHPYEYLDLETMQGNGKARKDKNLVPLNSDFDLYSVGKDGKTSSPLTAKASHDDIVRANNGGFIGLATDY